MRLERDITPTTALCIEALEEMLGSGRVDSVLDVGTGSGILALTALLLGVPQAVGPGYRS